MTKSPGLLSRWMRVVGWLCAFGIALMMFDLVRFLQWIPAEWWSQEQTARAPGSGLEIAGRVMWADLGLAWLGQWGYLGSLLWIPAAIVWGVRGSRAGVVALPSERILFAVVCLLLIAITALVHLTPLRYPHYNFIVF
jgi:hypothetical protein